MFYRKGKEKDNIDDDIGIKLKVAKCKELKNLMETLKKKADKKVDELEQRDTEAEKIFCEKCKEKYPARFLELRKLEEEKVVDNLNKDAVSLALDSQSAAMIGVKSQEERLRNFIESSEDTSALYSKFLEEVVEHQNEIEKIWSEGSEITKKINECSAQMRNLKEDLNNYVSDSKNKSEMVEYVNSFLNELNLKSDGKVSKKSSFKPPLKN